MRPIFITSNVHKELLSIFFRRYYAKPGLVNQIVTGDEI